MPVLLGRSQAVDSTHTTNAISCPTTSFFASCRQLGLYHHLQRHQLGSGAGKDGLHALEAVSCTSSSFCMATDKDGNVLTYNGT
jgi:hypothetical protein